MNELRIGERKYPLVADSLLPSGKRAIVRNYRDTNVRDPARIRRVEWALSGPIGNSLESVSGVLGVDYTQNLETRHPRRLLSLGKRNTVTLSGSGAVSVVTVSALMGTPLMAAAVMGGTEALFGSSGTSGDVVRFIRELRGYLFVFHGAVVNQIDMSTWTVVDTETLPGIPTGVEVWNNWMWIALGSSQRMSVILDASASGMNLQHNWGVETLLVTALAVGSDRLWFGIFDGANPDQPKNNISYTFDFFNTYANPFPVGDPNENINGIGPFGPYTYVGKNNGIFSFTDQGKPAPLSKALLGHRSAHNGKWWADAGWGWNYCTTDIGQRAISGHTDNPVGIGERMKQFTGHGGRPTALFADRGEKWDAYLTTAGHSYMYRCVFSDETAGTGQPDLYPSRYLTSTEIGAIFASNTPTNPVIIWGEDGDIAYETISRDGRDDLFSSRLYSTSGGIWYGTTCDRDPHLLKTIRLARVRYLNLEPCSTWTLAFSFDLDPWDSDPEYINCGSEIDVSGQYTLRPNSVPGGQPNAKNSGRNFKPRLTQVAEGPNAETLPPEVNGVLEVEYDERPAYIEEVVCVLQASSPQNAQSLMEELQRLASEQTNGPTEVRLPGDLPNEPKYAMVASVEARKDLAGDAVEGVEVVLHIWETK